MRKWKQTKTCNCYLAAVASPQIWSQNRAHVTPTLSGSDPLFWLLVKDVVCRVKNREDVLLKLFTAQQKIRKNFHLHPKQKSEPIFFTGCKLRPPDIGIEANVLQELLIGDFHAESVLVPIFFVINEYKNLGEATSGRRSKLKSDGRRAVRSNLQSWVLDMHQVWTACPNMENSGCEVRIGISDLLVAAVATADWKRHLKRLADKRWLCKHLH